MRPVHLYVDAFPVRSETFVAAEARELAALGHPVLVVAGSAATASPAAPWSAACPSCRGPSARERSREKLAAAALVTSGSDHTVRHLRDLAGPDATHRVVKVVMGVDPNASRRAGPPAAGATVAAIGRLVEKKGFVHLVRAAAEPALRDRLEAEVDRLGLGGVVALPGALTPAGVRDVLEAAAVFAAPSVIAADGDGDSMPVVIKEALAMEVPVVAGDVTGLQEIVRPAFGRLVAPAASTCLPMPTYGPRRADSARFSSTWPVSRRRYDVQTMTSACRSCLNLGTPLHMASHYWRVRSGAEEVSRLRHAVCDYAGSQGISAQVLQDLAIAVSEVLSNAVVHAFRDNVDDDGIITVMASVNDDELTVRVVDDGIGMAPRTDSPGAGLGLAIATSVARRVVVERPARGGTEVRMTFAATA